MLPPVTIGREDMDDPPTTAKPACHCQNGMPLEAMLESMSNEPKQDDGCLA